ncbi:hypothetical protein Lser_V15G05367 [Lactuca serriola]
MVFFVHLHHLGGDKLSKEWEVLLCYEKDASTISYFFNKKVYDGGVDNYGRHDYYCVKN